MKRRNEFTDRLKGLTFSAVTAALYVVLSFLCKAMGLLDGAVQLRFSEALCVLCAFTPYAVPGITLGCFLTNLLTGAAPLDILVGPIATLLGALFGRMLAPKNRKTVLSLFLVTLPTVLANTLFMPPVILYAYGAEFALPLVFLSVGIGEFFSASVLGVGLGVAVKKVKLRV